jgi:hypothetical protein
LRYISDYNEANNILKTLSKFSIGSNDNSKQRAASIIAKNDEDRICSTKIKEIIKLPDEHVRCRSASIVTAKPVNEGKELQRLLTANGVKLN